MQENAPAEMSSNIPYVVMAVYLMVLLGLGLLGYMKSKSSEEDYYLAGRNQGWLVSSLTIMATFFSSFALLGAPGMVYKEGVVFALFSLNVPVGGMCVYLLGARIWRAGRAYGYVTPADMVADYYGSAYVLRLLVAFTGFLYAIPYVMMQIKAGGDISAALFSKSEYAFEIGAVILAIITTLYIMIGGMRSVAWTDVLQGLLLMGGMFLGGFAAIGALGGLSEFGRRVTTELPDSSLTLPGTSGAWPMTQLLSVCLLASSGSMIQPAQWMRYYAVKNAKVLRRGAVIFSVVLTACFILGIMFVGLGGQVLYPLDGAGADVKPHSAIQSFDRILVVLLSEQLPELVGNNLGTILSSVVIIAIMAASMSTADSNLHALSAVAVRDVYDRMIRPGATESERIWVGRAVIVFAAGLSLILVIYGEFRVRANNPLQFMQMIALLGFTAIAFSSQLLPVTVDILFLRRGTRAGATMGLAGGLLGAFLFSGLYPPLIESLGKPAFMISIHEFVLTCKSTVKMHESAYGLIINIPLFVLVSLVTRRVDHEKRARFGRILSGIEK